MTDDGGFYTRCQTAPQAQDKSHGSAVSLDDLGLSATNYEAGFLLLTFAGLREKAMHIVASRRRQLIFDAPDFFKNRISFHGFIFP